jgi:Purple acid Phosphatase, N-terminal domain
MKRKPYAAIVLALLATLVTFAPVQADIVCTVSATLTISDVSATNIKHNCAVIRWRTDGKATSEVFYDTVSHDSIVDYAYFTRERKALIENHKVTLNKLYPSTTYYYRVRSMAGGAEFVSDEYTFTTLSSPRGLTAWLSNLFPEYVFPFYLSWLW